VCVCVCVLVATRVRVQHSCVQRSVCRVGTLDIVVTNLLAHVAHFLLHFSALLLEKRNDLERIFLRLSKGVAVMSGEAMCAVVLVVSVRACDL
jgi:hypothetical protein